MDIRVLDANPIYINQTFRLKFKFTDAYPIGAQRPKRPRQPHLITRTDISITEAPEVTFVRTPDRPIPVHPHIYSNGFICLDLLGKQGWSPVQNVQSICMSIQSMLTGNTKPERPPGDEEFVRTNRQTARDVSYIYHDNQVWCVYIMGGVRGMYLCLAPCRSKHNWCPFKPQH